MCVFACAQRAPCEPWWITCLLAASERENWTVHLFLTSFSSNNLWLSELISPHPRYRQPAAGVAWKHNTPVLFCVSSNSNSLPSPSWHRGTTLPQKTHPTVGPIPRWPEHLVTKTSLKAFKGTKFLGRSPAKWNSVDSRAHPNTHRISRILISKLQILGRRLTVIEELSECVVARAWTTQHKTQHVYRMLLSARNSFVLTTIGSLLIHPCIIQSCPNCLMHDFHSTSQMLTDDHWQRQTKSAC